MPRSVPARRQLVRCCELLDEQLIRMPRAPRESHARAITALREELEQVLEVVKQFDDASRVQRFGGILHATDREGRREFARPTRRRGGAAEL